jgi:hypothetical protein
MIHATRANVFAGCCKLCNVNKLICIILKYLIFPSSGGGFASDLTSFPLAKGRRPRLSAHTPQGDGSGVLALIRSHVPKLAGRDLANHDGGGIGVSRALFAFWSTRHSYSLMLSGKLCKPRDSYD